MTKIQLDIISRLNKSEKDFRNSAIRGWIYHILYDEKCLGIYSDGTIRYGSMTSFEDGLSIGRAAEIMSRSDKLKKFI